MTTKKELKPKLTAADLKARDAKMRRLSDAALSAVGGGADAGAVRYRE
jgi:hypothetical protein